MAKRKTKAETAIDAAVIEKDDLLDSGLFDGDEAPPPEDGGPAPCEAKPRPEPTDPAWSDYVLSHLIPGEETDPEGNPSTDGLRRVAELLLGPIVEVIPEVVETPSSVNFQRSVARVIVAIAWGGDRDDVRRFGGAADVYAGNTDDKFLRHGVATVDTRAEGKALRRALKLRKVIAAEESTRVPVAESGLGNLVTDGQVAAINKICRDLDINLMAYANSGKKKYATIREMSYQTALDLIKDAGKYGRDQAAIPAAIRGYDPDWAAKSA